MGELCGPMFVKVMLDVPVIPQLKYTRSTDTIIHLTDPDTKQLYSLSFASSNTADEFQEWLDYAVTQLTRRTAPTRPPRTLNASASSPTLSSLSGESDAQQPQPQPRPAPRKPPRVVDSPQPITTTTAAAAAAATSAANDNSAATITANGCVNPFLR